MKLENSQQIFEKKNAQISNFMKNLSRSLSKKQWHPPMKVYINQDLPFYLANSSNFNLGFIGSNS
jgi:hypothetical protein